MKKIEQMDECLKSHLLAFLYEKEMLNIQLIHTIECEQLGDLYVTFENHEVVAILHLAFDGNSYFTNFSYKTEQGLKAIQMQLNNLDYKRVLVAGTYEDVTILNQSPLKSKDVFMKYNEDLLSVELPVNMSFYRASIEDMNVIGEMFIDYFEVTTDDEKADVAAPDKLVQKIEGGLYLLKLDDEVMGMARFSGSSKQFINITSVYIKPNFRQQGYGSLLLKLMIQAACPLTPVLQTSYENHSALKMYTALGFEEIFDYAFEFIV